MLPIIDISESREKYEVKVGLLYAGVKISYQQTNSLFQGLTVNGEMFPMTLPWPTTLKKCQIHRKSGFVSLELRKNMQTRLVPKICIEMLPKATSLDYKLSTMAFCSIDPETLQVRNESKVLTDRKKWAFNLMKASEKHDCCEFQFPNQTSIIVVFDQTFQYPAVDSASTETVVVTGWYCTLKEIPSSLASKLTGLHPIIAIEADVQNDLNELLGFYHQLAWKAKPKGPMKPILITPISSIPL
jgi:hypothetical protein